MTGSRRSRLAAGAGAVLLAAATVTAGTTALAPAAALATRAGGTPGYCPTGAGVTVVVDFQELGGGIVVRCAPGPVVPGFTGLDALQQAGFDPAGTQRWGFAFICRIAGRPTATQTLPINGDPHYHEECVDTPPVTAFWSYWYAHNGGSWAESTSGAMSHDAIPGGFEGWSFSLNHTVDTAPPPGIAPRRPPAAPPSTPPPSSPPRSSKASTSPRTSPHSAPSSTRATTAPVTTAPSPDTPHRHSQGALVTPMATSGSPPHGPADPVARGHNAAGEKVSGALPAPASSGHGSAVPLVVGLAVVACLVVGAVLTGWRRRTRS